MIRRFKETLKTNADRRSAANRRGRYKKRSILGSSIAELPPVLFILFIVLFFPFVDLVSMGLSWLAGWNLSDSLTRQAAMISQSAAAQTLKDATNNWLKSPLGKLARASHVATEVAYNSSLAANDPDPRPGFAGNQIVIVTAKISCAPLLTIPAPVSVAGLSAPVTFTFTGSRLMENPLDVSR